MELQTIAIQDLHVNYDDRREGATSEGVLPHDGHVRLLLLAQLVLLLLAAQYVDSAPEHAGPLDQRVSQ